MTAGEILRALIERGGSISFACWDGIPGGVIAAACAITCAAEAETMKSHEVLTPSPSPLRDKGDAGWLTHLSMRHWAIAGQSRSVTGWSHVAPEKLFITSFPPSIASTEESSFKSRSAQPVRIKAVDSERTSISAA